VAIRSRFRNVFRRDDFGAAEAVDPYSFHVESPWLKLVMFIRFRRTDFIRNRPKSVYVVTRGVSWLIRARYISGVTQNRRCMGMYLSMKACTPIR
jgi:hypothetical protein